MSVYSDSISAAQKHLHAAREWYVLCHEEADEWYLHCFDQAEDLLEILAEVME